MARGLHGFPLVHGVVLFAATLLVSTPSAAHPHVFVDGGVDFVFREDNVLEAMKVTWLYDEFETLYILSSYGMSLNSAGALDEADRLELVRLRSMWPSDFDGSAHLSIDGARVFLEWPTGLDATFVDGRLQVTFTRVLEKPTRLSNASVEVAFYESTYFFAFSLTNEPKLLGQKSDCTAQLVPFDPDAGDADLLATLAKLSREETHDIKDVGALFADRIVLQCV